MAAEETGICINCGHEGPVGTACREEACARKGYYFIPAEYASKAEQDDPYLGRKIDDFAFVDVLGEGGFGKVYLALMTPVLMPVAIKFLTRANNKEMLQRFYREAKSLAMMAHPNIVRLNKYGIYNNKPYIAMEYVESSRSLAKEIRDRVRAQQAFTLREVVHIVDQILNALKVAHGHNVVHRDIKPENILLQNIEGDPIFAKVLDFGLAKFTNQDSKMSMVLGTPMYMAPEQLGTGSEIGPWTDLYAVAVIVFEILTGRRPFKGNTPREIIGHKIDPGYDFMEHVQDLNLPPKLVDFFRKGMAVDEMQRFRTVDDFRTAFHSVLNSMGSKKTEQIFSGTLEDILDTTDKKKIEFGSTNVELEAQEVKQHGQTTDGNKAMHEDVTRIEDTDYQKDVPEGHAKTGASKSRITIVAGVIVILVGIIGYVVLSGSKGAGPTKNGRHEPATGVSQAGKSGKKTVKVSKKITTPVKKSKSKVNRVNKKAAAAFKVVKILPVFKSSNEIAPGVNVYINGKLIGVTRSRLGVEARLPLDTKHVEIRLAGKNISHEVIDVVDPHKIKGSKLAIKVEMSW